MTIGHHPVITADDVAWLTADEMIEVDRVMVDDLHIELIQMMENAGRNLARLVLDLLGPSTATVLAGSGGNGGGGLVAARHLAVHGVEVTVVVGSEPEGVPGHQLDIVERMGLRVGREGGAPPADAVIDALVGYRLAGAPRGRVGELVDRAGDLGPVIALDTPSGLDVTDGSTPGAVVEARATLTLALPKVGLRRAPAVGDLYLADISVPPSVYETMGVGPVPDFSASSILAIRR